MNRKLHNNLLCTNHQSGKPLPNYHVLPRALPSANSSAKDVADERSTSNSEGEQYLSQFLSFGLDFPLGAVRDNSARVLVDALRMLPGLYAGLAVAARAVVRGVKLKCAASLSAAFAIFSSCSAWAFATPSRSRVSFSRARNAAASSLSPLLTAASAKCASSCTSLALRHAASDAAFAVSRFNSATTFASPMLTSNLALCNIIGCTRPSSVEPSSLKLFVVWLKLRGEGGLLPRGLLKSGGAGLWRWATRP